LEDRDTLSGLGSILVQRFGLACTRLHLGELLQG
jgi:hypothetical protein